MAKEYITKDQAKEVFINYMGATSVRVGILADCLYSRVPVADVTEVIHSQWLPDNRPGGGFWVCDHCKFPSEAHGAKILYKYCPNCGAKMDGGGRNEQT